MHNAALSTLLDVVNHYDSIPANNPNLDQRLRRPGGQTQQLNLTQQEKDDLVAFLRTLTGTSVYTDTKWSDPFDSNAMLNVIVLPLNNDALVFSGSGASRQVTVSVQAVPHVSYIFQTSTDLNNWTSTTIVAPASGHLSMTVAAPEGSSECFYRYIYQPSM